MKMELSRKKSSLVRSSVVSMVRETHPTSPSNNLGLANGILLLAVAPRNDKESVVFHGVRA